MIAVELGEILRRLPLAEGVVQGVVDQLRLKPELFLHSAEGGYVSPVISVYLGGGPRVGSRAKVGMGQDMSAAAILKLQTVGFSIEQTMALADVIDSQASSKSDLLEVEHRLGTKVGEVKAELDGVEHRLETKIGEVKAELKADIAEVKANIGEVKAELKADIAEVKANIGEVKAELKASIAGSKLDTIKWVFGIAFAQTGVTLAVLKLFVH